MLNWIPGRGDVVDKRYYFGIDAIRFTAALLVVAFHLCFWSWTATDSTPGRILGGAARFPHLAPFAWFGWIGVEIFFVISGLVIANSANNRTPIAFLNGRALRLYPGAWICATISAAVLLTMRLVPVRHLAREYLGSITLVPFTRT